MKKWNGSTFADVAGAPPVSLFGIWGSAADNLIAVGASGTIVTYAGGTFKSSSIADALTGVAGAVNGIASQSGMLTAVGEWGSTLRHDGTKWTSIASSPYIQFRAVAATAQDLLAVGYDGSMMASPSRVYTFSGGSFHLLERAQQGHPRRGLDSIESPRGTGSGNSSHRESVRLISATRGRAASWRRTSRNSS